MEGKIEELRKDIQELESLQKQATRPKVQDFLSLHTRKLITELVSLEQQPQGASCQQSGSAQNTGNRHYQVKLDNYAWDQSSKAVKFYVNIPKVQTIPAENVHCDFTSKSLDLTVKNLENKDYVFTIKNLLFPIDPQQSNWKIKTDTIIITAIKVEPQNWSHVTEIEKKASDSKKLVPDIDEQKQAGGPTEGLMSIMRSMYEKGDDEMKRTIAKAWTESQMKSNSFM